MFDESSVAAATAPEAHGKSLLRIESTRETYLLTAMLPAYASVPFNRKSLDDKRPNWPRVMCVTSFMVMLCKVEILMRRYESRQVVSDVLPDVDA